MLTSACERYSALKGSQGIMFAQGQAKHVPILVPMKLSMTTSADHQAMESSMLAVAIKVHSKLTLSQYAKPMVGNLMGAPESYY